jgi:pimeloyl-ACP methyl ester carboxylesterase
MAQGAREYDNTIDGHRIHYLEMRSRGGGGKSIVLVPGLGGNAQDWTPLMLPLAKSGYHAYAPDSLGFGRSDQPDVDYLVPLEAHARRAVPGLAAVRQGRLRYGQRVDGSRRRSPLIVPTTLTCCCCITPQEFGSRGKSDSCS